MIGTMGWQQLLLILLILALLFGARRISDLGGALGRGIKEFRTEVRDQASEEEPETPDQEGGAPTVTTTQDTTPAATSGEERDPPRI